MRKITFALFFANRGFFPGELIADARREMAQAVRDAGYDYLMMEESETRYGAVETLEEGKKFARFLEEHRGEYQGVILCLPNFGDENGASAALRSCEVPILVQAYPDEEGKMDFAHRRDAMCGKIAMCNVLRQCGIRYTILKPFTVHPSSAAFAGQLETFAGICRVVDGMRHYNLGLIGARTTAFKTVRIDEIGMQRMGINVETFDLGEVFRRMRQVPQERIDAKKEEYLAITRFDFPMEKLDAIARLGAVTDDLIREYDLNGIAMRCWNELQLEFGIAPCMVLGVLNEKGIAASCEVDAANTLMMQALALAGGTPSMLLDINNNFRDDPNRCILFHCGPVPISLMEGKGQTIEHKMFVKSYGEGSGVGVNQGVLRRGAVSFGSMKTENGRICAYLGEGELTHDPIEPEFFGTGSVLYADGMDGILDYIGKNGYRHHMAVAPKHVCDAAEEALSNYLGYEVKRF